MTFTDGSGPSAAIHPMPWGSGWLAVTEQTFLDRDIRAWTAPAPQGPWTEPTAVGPANIGQIPPLPPGGFSYGARLVQLPGSGWILAWNINDDFWDLIANVRLYGPHFATPVNSAAALERTCFSTGTCPFGARRAARPADVRDQRELHHEVASEPRQLRRLTSRVRQARHPADPFAAVLGHRL